MENKSNDLEAAITAAYLAMKPFDSMTADRALQIAAIKVRHEFENERREGMLGIAAMFGNALSVTDAPSENTPPPFHTPKPIIQAEFGSKSGPLSPDEIQKLHEEDTKK